MDVRLSSSSPISDVSFIKSAFSFVLYSSGTNDPIARHDFVTNILDHVRARQRGLDALPSSVRVLHSPRERHQVRYASLRGAPGGTVSLPCAALSLDPIVQEVTCATVQALFMMIRFIYDSYRASSETRWLLTGLCTRVTQTVRCFSSFP